MRPPFRLDLLWPRLESIADEVASTLVRTAFSHDVVECRDMAVAICDPLGRLLAHSHLGATGHIGSVPGLMRALMARYAPGTMKDGDAFCCNDPWVASGHTPDVFVVTPAFAEDRLAGFIVTAVHHADIGGRAGAGDVQEIYEEGLVLPLVQLQRAHVESDDVLAIVRRNVRFGDHVVGDLRAQIAACHIGVARVRSLVADQGVGTLEEVGEEIVTRTEASMRQAILELGPGTRRAGCRLDATDVDGAPLRIELALTVHSDGTLEADFTGTSLQVTRPINCPTQYALAYIVVATKLVCRVDAPTNDGAYRVVRITAPEGSLLNPTHPAPVFWRLATGLMVAELIMRCFAESVPDRVPAESGSLPVWQFYVTGRRRNGLPFSLHQHAFGGMGGRPSKDGLASVSFPYNVRDVSVEMSEMETPILIRRRQLRVGSGGAGRHRGGDGEVVEITTAPDGDLDERATLAFSGGAGRFAEGPAGARGGLPGASAAIELDGEPLPASTLGNSPHVVFRPGQVLRLLLPGGGGYGPPAARDPAEAEADEADGLLAAAVPGEP